MRYRGGLVCLLAMLGACASQPPLALPAAEIALAPATLAFPGVIDLPLSAGHWIDADCGLGDPRIACIATAIGVGLGDLRDSGPPVESYVAALKTKGWSEAASVRPGTRVLRNPQTQRCASLSSDRYDDGKSARIRYTYVVRIELDPPGVSCSDAQPIIFPGFLDLPLLPGDHILHAMTRDAIVFVETPAHGNRLTSAREKDYLAAVEAAGWSRVASRRGQVFRRNGSDDLKCVDIQAGATFGVDAAALDPQRYGVTFHRRGCPTADEPN